MVSATATTNLERPIRGLFASRIARTIFLANLVGLVALTVGALLLSETRNTLTQAQISALQVQGGVIAKLLPFDADTFPVRTGAVWWLRTRERDGHSQTVVAAVQSPDTV
jgi:hypothetical protein